VTAPLTNAIVMVDDEKSYTDVMSQMLEENLGCRVAAFTRPLDALSALAELKPAVVVTDYYMPQIDGIEFIRRASSLLPNAAFVLITGHNLAEAQDRMDRICALKGFLPKPFGWRRLADEIVRVWPEEAPAPALRADATSV
jgi:DNA-binding NtrC family response regulator